MNWETFYLTCFLAGLLLTVVSFVFGAHLHLHLPMHLHFTGLHLPHVTAHTGADSVSPLNLTSMVVFVTWFGATGYLVTHYKSSAAGIALLAATFVGLAGGALMYLFLARVLIGHEQPLVDADFEMVGVLGRVSNPIRTGGTGELIYSQEGTRRSCGARSEEGDEIDRGSEVVVMRYAKGIAYVRRWDEKKQSLA
jgi:membrane protein implicated in regulation of membrane protease activity